MKTSVTLAPTYKQITSSIGSVYYCGKFTDFDGNGEDSIAKKLLYTESTENIASQAQQLIGHFSFVLIRDNQALCISDITRTHPILYQQSSNGDIHIADNVGGLSSANLVKLSDPLVTNFLSTGYTLDNSTLYQNVFQVTSAELCCISHNSGIKRYQYWDYLVQHKNNPAVDFSNCLNTVNELLFSVGKSMSKALSGATAVVPLSGGYDSRLILSLLLEQKHERIICYTYGAPGSPEIKFAKRVAEKLSVKLIVIVYQSEFFDQMVDVQELENFFHTAAAGSSIPHLQDFYAVKYMKKNNLIPRDSVFVPGHSGDIFAGTHIEKDVKLTDGSDVLSSYLFKKHFWLNKPAINTDLPHVSFDRPVYSIMENWSWKERQSKFIVNSCRNYEFFSYDFYLPLWDIRLASYFKNIPLKHKNRRASNYSVGSNLYDAACFRYFSQLGVDFERISDGFLARAARRARTFFSFGDGINNLDHILVRFGYRNKLRSRRFNGRVAHVLIGLLNGQG